MIRVRFPDNHTLEAPFHPSETIQSLVDLLSKVVAHPELSFYLCECTVIHHCLEKPPSNLALILRFSFLDTTPPKKQIKDTSQDLYTAGFVPGAIVYFAHNAPNGTRLIVC